MILSLTGSTSRGKSSVAAELSSGFRRPQAAVTKDTWNELPLADFQWWPHGVEVKIKKAIALAPLWGLSSCRSSE